MGTLSDNKFKDLDCFECLKGLESLTHLDISGNDFELEASDLKLKIFELLPQLEYLDDEDSEEDDEEDSDDEEDGPGLSALYDNTALLDEDEDIDDEEEDDDESAESKGKKRKIDEAE